MKTQVSSRKRGFTLLETVIAIGVLAVLLTGFIIVFAPAAAGIKKAINVQEANRLTTALEQEIVTLRGSQENSNFQTGFGKAFEWIKDGATSANDALLVYQYRGSLSSVRPDGTPEPVATIGEKLPGQDYVVQPMVRRKSDSKFNEDLLAVEGSVYLVKCTQLIFDQQSGGLIAGKAGQIVDPKSSGTVVSQVDQYPEAVIAFAAEFHALPAKSKQYFDSRFMQSFATLKNPIFTRNLAARR